MGEALFALAEDKGADAEVVVGVGTVVVLGEDAVETVGRIFGAVQPQQTGAHGHQGGLVLGILLQGRLQMRAGLLLLAHQQVALAQFQVQQPENVGIFPLFQVPEQAQGLLGLVGPQQHLGQGELGTEMLGLQLDDLLKLDSRPAPVAHLHQQLPILEQQQRIAGISPNFLQILRPGLLQFTTESVSLGDPLPGAGEFGVEVQHPFPAGQGLFVIAADRLRGAYVEEAVRTILVQLLGEVEHFLGLVVFAELGVGDDSVTVGRLEIGMFAIDGLEDPQGFAEAPHPDQVDAQAGPQFQVFHAVVDRLLIGGDRLIVPIQLIQYKTAVPVPGAVVGVHFQGGVDLVEGLGPPTRLGQLLGSFYSPLGFKPLVHCSSPPTDVLGRCLLPNSRVFIGQVQPRSRPQNDLNYRADQVPPLQDVFTGSCLHIWSGAIQSPAAYWGEIAMKTAFVGLPGSGKSSLFTAVTGRPIPAGELHQEHVGVVTVPEPRLPWLVEHYQPKKETPATIEMVDIPGISLSEAHGQDELRKHLPTIRQCEVLVAVVRDFENPSVPQYRDRIDPAGDLAELRDEFLFADLDSTTRRIEKLEKTVSKPSKTQDLDKRELALLQKCRDALENGQPLSEVITNPEDARILGSFQFLTEKPLVVVYNVDESRAAEEPSETPPHAYSALSLCARAEADIVELDPEDRPAFLEELGLSAPASERLIQRCFDALGLIVFFTVGADEVRAWPIIKGTPAQEAAGKIHTDLARGFIRAETVAYDDLIAAGDMRDAKSAGKVRQEGKTYIVQDGDVINVKFNV